MSLADGGALYVRSYYDFEAYRAYPSTFYVGAGLVIEDNFVETIMEGNRCPTYIGCPKARGAGIFVEGNVGNSVNLGDHAIIRNNWGKGYKAWGGGIYAEGPSHDIRAGANLTVTGNTLLGGDLGQGAGIFLGPTCDLVCCSFGEYYDACGFNGPALTAGDGLRVEYNVVYGDAGGGIYLLSSDMEAGAYASISHNRLYDDQANPTSQLGAGLALFSYSSAVFGDLLSVRNNSFETIQNREQYGGGIYMINSDFTAGDHMVLDSNTGVGGSLTFGHGAYVEYTSAFRAGDYLSITNNVAPSSYGTVGIFWGALFHVGR